VDSRIAELVSLAWCLLRLCSSPARIWLPLGGFCLPTHEPAFIDQLLNHLGDVFELEGPAAFIKPFVYVV